MVTRIHPLDVKLTFENRPYKLGEAVDLAIELTPKANVEVREGRVELLYEEHYAETRTVMVPDYKASGSSAPGTAGVSPLTPMIPKHITESRTESYIHGSVVFLKDTHVQSGDAQQYTAELRIDSDSPPYVGNATVKWSLLVAIDVAHAVDIHEKQPINVAFG